MDPRDRIKRFLYHTKLLGIWHRLVNRNTLTVVMFHRVLPAEDRRWATADPEYTVSEQFFRDCLRFFRKHYNVIGISDFAKAGERGAPLPPCALLITFDDGWADTLQVAAPLLREAGLPALVFVATDPVESREEIWWQDMLAFAASNGRLGEVARILDWPGPSKNSAAVVNNAPDFLDLLSILHELDDAGRTKALSDLADGIPNQRQMLRSSDFADLQELGLEIASHGASHRPFTALGGPSLTEDLHRSRKVLVDLVDRENSVALSAVSVPHGRIDQRVANTLADEGFQYIFTSSAYLNRTLPRFDNASIMGRIAISEHGATNQYGALEPHKLANWLMMRPRKSARMCASAKA